MDGEDSKNPFMQTSTNPFEDDIDDDTFLRSSTSKLVVNQHPKNPFSDDIAQGDADSEVDRIQSRTLASTERSLAVLMESELVGEGIAKELSGQKEQLENCNKKMDDINANLRNSQKHLRRIKSFFGGFKDFLLGVRIKPVRHLIPVRENQPSDESFGENQHVTTHRSRSTTIRETPSSLPVLMHRSSDGDGAGPRNAQRAIDRNLDQMFSHVVNLKGLATDLGEELDGQNELLDSLNDKTEEAHISLGKQNKDISKLLK